MDEGRLARGLSAVRLSLGSGGGGGGGDRFRFSGMITVEKMCTLWTHGEIASPSGIIGSVTW